jgi:hypothetical protein
MTGQLFFIAASMTALQEEELTTLILFQTDVVKVTSEQSVLRTNGNANTNINKLKNWI